MRRTQLYLEDDLWKTLQILARQSHCTISELVRSAVREKYLASLSKRKESLLAAVGIWKDRTDLPATTEYIRRLRKDDRLKRVWK
ncbi:MAG TPA: ribbon-helix-helix protein, CopG family [Bryobacteraceae bacterium]|nr:ribbon-helix-helix protein, CopG family [Bryobacteraceae bacterium]